MSHPEKQESVTHTQVEKKNNRNCCEGDQMMDLADKNFKAL